jgi:hypothetical protein
MVVLADELLEGFFDEDLQKSWQLETLIAEERPQKPGAVGWFNSIVSTLVTDENKEKFNSLADLAGKSLRIQSIESKPSIGKLDAASSAILPTRGSLLSRTPAASHSPSSSSSSNPNPLSAASMRDTPAYATPSPTSMPASTNPWTEVQSLSRNDRDFEIVSKAVERMDRPRFSEDAIIVPDGDEDLGAGADLLEEEVGRFVIEDEDEIENSQSKEEDARAGRGVFDLAL